MTQTPTFALARHSETLEWYKVAIAPFFDGDFNVLKVEKLPNQGEISFTLVLSDFSATHVHYKGHGYRRFADVKVEGKPHVFYGDAEGNYWLRPKDMFEGCLEDGTIRFRALQ
jgi:hypothetical protein